MPQEDKYYLKPSEVVTIGQQGREKIDLQLDSVSSSDVNRSLTGVVKNASGDLLYDVDVVIMSITYKPLYVTHTSKDGSYTFNKLSAGSYTVIASHDGYALPAVQSFTFGSSGGTITKNFTLTPITGVNNNAIYGIIRNSSGKSIANAIVTVNDHSENLIATTTSDSLGQYACGSLSKGNYTVTVTASGYYNSDTYDVVVGSAGYVMQNFVLQDNPEEMHGVISGIITDDEGHPLAGAIVGLYHEDKESGTETLIALSVTQNSGIYIFADIIPNQMYRVKSKVVNSI